MADINIIPTKRKMALWQPELIKRAIVDALLKVNPLTLAKNPVMFVVEIGAILTSILFIRDLFEHLPAYDLIYKGQISLWLWFTVLFANFAEAMAEGRGKAQADTLRRSRQET